MSPLRLGPGTDPAVSLATIEVVDLTMYHQENHLGLRRNVTIGAKDYLYQRVKCDPLSALRWSTRTRGWYVSHAGRIDLYRTITLEQLSLESRSCRMSR